MKLARKLWTAAWAAAAVSVFVAGAAQATSALYVTDSQQAQLSTAVVVATVGEARASMSERYHQAITRTGVEVEEVLYGAAPPRLTVEQFGGTVGDRTWYVPGDARLEEGQRCVLFLRQVDGEWFLTAMEQSKYELRETAGLGATMHRTLSGGIFVRDDALKLVEYREPAERPARPLSALRALLAELPPAGLDGAR